MKNNKPKYSIFKNAKYALDGLVEVMKRETSFKIEVICSFIILIIIYFIDISISHKLILIISLFLIMIIELINSAIENIVDLITKEIHPLAKNAKDIGATAVLFSVILHIICWILIILKNL